MSSNRIRVLLVSLLAVFAFSAVASASASAHEFLVEGKAVTAPVAFTGTSGATIFTFHIGSEKGEFECTGGTMTGFLEEAGKATNHIEFTKCKVIKPASCKIHEPIKFETKNLLVGNEPGVEDEFKPTEAEETLVTLGFTDCALEKQYKIKGTYTCKLPGVATEAIAHEIACEPSGSKLKFGSEPMTVRSTENIKLVSGKSWSAN